MMGIYKIENLINGKVYIGQSINIENRWEQHKKVLFKKESKEKTYPLYKAFEKYGLENFKFEVLEECNSIELADKEIFYIKKYNSYIYSPNSNGYNLTIGGEGHSLITEKEKEKIVSLWEEKKSISEICFFTNHTANTIRKVLREKESSYSIEESKNRGKKISDANMKTKKSIDCYTIYGEYITTYSSIREACRALNLDRRSVKRACEGIHSRVKEYRFTYAQEKKRIVI